MKVKVNTNTGLTLVQQPSVLVLLVWSTVLSALIFKPNIEQLVELKDPLQVLYQPLLFIPIIITVLLYALVAKTTVNFDRISNNVYIKTSSLIKKSQQQIPFSQIASVEGLERAHYVKNRTKYYYFEIYLKLKNGTSVLIGASNYKYTQKERELSPTDPLIINISTFLGVQNNFTRINFDNTIANIPLSNIKTFSFLQPIINKVGHTQKQLGTEIYFNSRVTPKDQEALKKFAKQFEESVNIKYNAQTQKTTSEEPLNNLKEDTNQNTDNFGFN